MKRMIESAPKALIGAAAVALLLRGPIPQPSNYHDFADQRFLLGFANGATRCAMEPLPQSIDGRRKVKAVPAGELDGLEA